MTKKHFIRLAEYVKAANGFDNPFNERQVNLLADFCEEVNPRFNRERWLGYIAGTNGKNDGKVK